MNRCTLTVRHPAEVQVTEIVNTATGIKTGWQLEGPDDDSIEVSDGHHTMEELYEHRIRLYLALVKIYDNYITPLNVSVKCWKSLLHDDGSSYEGWFILGMSCTKPDPNFGPNEQKFDISYHLPMKYWDLAKVIELERAPHYDGYTPNDVLERLLRL